MCYENPIGMPCIYVNPLLILCRFVDTLLTGCSESEGPKAATSKPAGKE